MSHLHEWSSARFDDTATSWRVDPPGATAYFHVTFVRESLGEDA